MKTYVLIQKDPRAALAQLAEELASVPGVHQIVQVEGPYDMVAEVDGHDLSMQQTVPRISNVDGVLRAIPLHVIDEGGETAVSVDVRSVQDLQMEPCTT
jgi:hypothetical protein